MYNRTKGYLHTRIVPGTHRAVVMLPARVEGWVPNTPLGTIDAEEGVFKTTGSYEGTASGNAYHVVACWNACEGYEGELRPGLLAEMAETIKDLKAELDDATKGVY